MNGPERARTDESTRETFRKKRTGQDTKEIKRALKLFAEREKYGLSVNDISKQTGVPRSTIFAKAKGAK
jgi:AcrR family transcriptional regulator